MNACVRQQLGSNTTHEPGAHNEVSHLDDLHCLACTSGLFSVSALMQSILLLVCPLSDRGHANSIYLTIDIFTGTALVVCTDYLAMICGI
jgi:hypothetical protein